MNTSLGAIKVIVGLSGGVDSSVAALLLKQAGFNVCGVYLKCYWTYEGCQSDQDRNSAARVASVLNIPFEVWDFELEYREKVVEYFFEEYKRGRTPNPDVVCNREIKFGLFLNKVLNEHSRSLSQIWNADRELDSSGRGPQNDGPQVLIATGHYARLGITEEEVRSQKSEVSERVVFPKFSQYEEVFDSEGIRYVGIGDYLQMTHDMVTDDSDSAGKDGKLALFGGVDSKKDQSYFLYDIPKGTYEHILYPLGNLTKKQVREIAKKENLPTADRPDSSGICFIGEVNIEKFLKERIPESRGDVIDKKGNVIGEHKGVQFYTVGQRHGFRIFNFQFSIFKQIPNPNDQNANRKLPYYVTGKDVEKNQLIVGMGEECKTDRFLVKTDRKIQITNHKPASSAGRLQITNKIQNSNQKKLYVRVRNLGEMIPCEIRQKPPLGYRVSSEPAVDVGREPNSATPYVSLPAHSPRLKSQDKPNEPTSEAAWASLETGILRERGDETLFEVALSYPVFGVASGQSAVFYRKFEIRNSKFEIWSVVGGGVIQ